MANADTILTMSDYTGLLRRRWVYLATIIPAAILVAVYLAYTLPALYQSSATILLEASSIPGDVVQTTVVSYADQQIELVQRKVMTRETLKELVEQIDPYPGSPEMSPGDKAGQIISDTSIERVDPVTLETLAVSNAFSIHYSNPDPKLAKDIARKLADLFLTYNQRSRAEQASQTYDFLLQQSKALAENIREIEGRLSEFKTKYGDALPTAQARNQEALDRTVRDLDGVESRLRIAEERESLLQVQLNQISPSLIGSVGGSPTDLPTLRAELAAAEQRYTPDHPDVKRLRRALAALQLEAAKTPGGAGVKADNPEYLSVASQLDGVRREVAALRANSARARSQINDYQQRLTSAPTVEREYAQLDREHEGARTQYAELQQKLQAANLAQNLESEQFGERYTLIRSPGVPDAPYSPNRLGIILIGLIVGGGLAVGSAVLAESSDPSVRSASDLRELTDIVTVGSVPVMLNAQDRKRRFHKLASGTVVFLIATGFVVLSIVQSG